jgi:hypothetical protein
MEKIIFKRRAAWSEDKRRPSLLPSKNGEEKKRAGRKPMHIKTK